MYEMKMRKYPHNMFSPTGKLVVAKTEAEHNRLEKLGYSHTKPKTKK